MKRLSFFCLAAMLLAWPSASRAELDIYIYQSGSNVMVTGSGSLDTIGLNKDKVDNSSSPYVYGSIAAIRVGAQGDAYDFDTSVSGPSQFGSGGLTYATSGTGDVFGINEAGGQLYTPHDYNSGTSLSGTNTYIGASLTSLGLTVGTYTYSWGHQNSITEPYDSLVVHIGSTAPFTAAVPEPSSMLLVISAAGIGLGARSWSHRRAARG